MTHPRPEPVESRPDPVEGPSDPEDLKIITLARSALARTPTGQGACVRDTDGRTYAGAGVHLEHLRLSAIAVAVAMAVSSGAPGLEAVALAGVDGPTNGDLAIVGDLPGTGVVVWHVDPRGNPQARIEL